MGRIRRYRRDIRLFRLAYRQFFYVKVRFDTRFNIKLFTGRRIILKGRFKRYETIRNETIRF